MQWDLALFHTSDMKGVSTMLLAHIKYRITHMLCSTLYAAITNELNCYARNAVFLFVFFKRIAVFQV